MPELKINDIDDISVSLIGTRVSYGSEGVN